MNSTPSQLHGQEAAGDDAPVAELALAADRRDAERRFVAVGRHDPAAMIAKAELEGIDADTFAYPGLGDLFVCIAAAAMEKAIKSEPLPVERILANLPRLGCTIFNNLADLQAIFNLEQSAAGIDGWGNVLGQVVKGQAALLKATAKVEAIKADLQIKAGTNRQGSTPGSRLDMVWASDVQIEEITWLWQDRIPCGMLTLIGGDPGVGKSFISLDLAARVTTGRDWPDGARNFDAIPRNVLILSNEDGQSVTVAPRLEGVGADRSKVALIKGKLDPRDGEKGPLFFSLAHDLIELEKRIIEARPAMVIIDPISSYLRGADTNRDNDVRVAMEPVVALAERYNIAIVGIMHLNKKSMSKALYRFSGSVGFPALVRAAFICEVDRDDNPEQEADRRKLFLCPKSTNTAELPTLSYRIDGSGKWPKVTWGVGTVDVTADEALSDRPRGPDPEAQDAAADFLREFLADGLPRKAGDVLKAGKAEGHSRATLYRARKSMGVEARNYAGDKCWRLPQPPAEAASHVSPEKELEIPEIPEIVVKREKERYSLPVPPSHVSSISSISSPEQPETDLADPDGIAGDIDSGLADRMDDEP